MTGARRSGRRPGDSGTKERIAAAAREAFGDLGFEAATIREIAGRAGVDPALVHHYFGSKQTLFLSVMRLPFDVERMRSAIVAGPADSMGARLIAFLIGMLDEEPAVRAFVTGLLRSATTDPGAAVLLREFLGREGLFELVASVAPDRHEIRATFLGSQFVGLVLARYVVRVEPLASLPRDQIVQIVGPTIQRYLTGDLPGSTPST